MAKFHTLNVKEVRRETADTVSILFEVPESLREAYAFIQGQYLTLKKDIKGEDVRRSYSICADPAEKELRVAVKKVEGGLFSSFANDELQAGDELEVMTPMGNFCAHPKQGEKQLLVFFAAGSGITPVISNIKAVLRANPQSEVTLFYGNKQFDSIIFREELEGIKNKYMSRFRLFHVLSRETLGSAVNSGRINAEKCDLWAKTVLNIESADDFYICGPEEMITGVSSWLEGKSVDRSNIHFELFTSPLGKLGGKQETEKPTVESDGTSSHIKVILDGDQIEFNLSEQGESILDAANRAGGDLPFACKGGVCCTCRAKVLSGKVEMDVNYALEEYEVEAGFVLTCQSHPRSEEVVVSFDEV